MVAVRSLTSKIYGDLGTFRQAGRPNLWRSQSGRVYLLGNGRVGGKGEGTLFLDKVAGKMGFAVPAHSLIVCDDFFNIPTQPLFKLEPPKNLPPETVNELTVVLQGLGLPPQIIIRSSALIEDGINSTAAGVFDSKFYGKFFVDANSLSGFRYHLQEVYDSNYSSGGRAHYRMMGYKEVPPLPIIIQDLIGKNWEYVPSTFFPALAGIVNTATPNKIKVTSVFGFGISAIEAAGLGETHVFNRELVQISAKGSTPTKFYWMDSNDGFMIRDHNPGLWQFIKGSFLMELAEKNLFSSIPIKLAKIALELKQMVGCPLDIEWALGAEDIPCLLQIRPLRPKKEAIPKPDINPENVLFSTHEVIGQGNMSFKHVIVVRSPHQKHLAERLEELFASFPNSLALYITYTERERTANALSKILFPYAQAVIVLDTVARHQSGSGLQHIALNILDKEKILLYADDITRLWEKLKTPIKTIECKEEDLDRGTIDVYELSEAIHVAVDDENEWGIVYLEQ